MSGTVGFRSVGLIVAIALAGTVYTARPAHAGGDLGKVLAGAVVGYLVYKALDDDDSGPRHHQRRYKPAPRKLRRTMRKARRRCRRRSVKSLQRIRSCEPRARRSKRGSAWKGARPERFSPRCGRARTISSGQDAERG